MGLTANTPLTFIRGEQSEYRVKGSTIIYEGAMLGDSSGYARGLLGGDPFIGHSMEYVDNSLGGDGALTVQRMRGRYRLEVTLTGVVITDVGQPVYASADGTLTFSAPGNSFVGIVARYVAANTAIVEFRPGEKDEFGANPNRVLKSANYTTDAADCGKIIYVDTDAVVITLLAGSSIADYMVTVVNAAAFGAAGIVVDFNAADNSAGGCGMAAGAAGKCLTNTKGTAQRGDYLVLASNGKATNAGWHIIDKRGTWAQE